jgi:hypothetical protein
VKIVGFSSVVSHFLLPCFSKHVTSPTTTMSTATISTDSLLQLILTQLTSMSKGMDSESNLHKQGFTHMFALVKSMKNEISEINTAVQILTEEHRLAKEKKIKALTRGREKRAKKSGSSLAPSEKPRQQEAPVIHAPPPPPPFSGDKNSIFDAGESADAKPNPAFRTPRSQATQAVSTKVQKKRLVPPAQKKQRLNLESESEDESPPPAKKKKNEPHGYTHSSGSSTESLEASAVMLIDSEDESFDESFDEAEDESEELTFSGNDESIGLQQDR